MQGWQVRAGGVRLEGKDVIVSIEPASVGYQCGGCGQGFLFADDHLPVRRIRDFPISGRRCYFEVALAQIDCPECRVGIEGVDWVDRYSRHTIRDEKYVAQLCGLLPATDVAQLESLTHSVVYRIDKKGLELRKQPREEPPVRHLGMDEISLKKGHRYPTVFYDLERRTVVGLVTSHRERAVGGFFRRWGRERCRKVKVGCMDLWTRYLNSAKRHLKNAAVVFDNFMFTSTSPKQLRRSPS